MRFSLVPEDRYTYREEGEVTFVDLLSAEEVAELKGDPSRASMVARRRAYARVMAELSHEKRVRLGGFEMVTTLPERSLDESKSLQGMVGGVAICLEGETSGSAHFFSATKSFAENEESLYLVIAYAKLDAVYVYNADDPETHALKKQGYGFGDRLRDETHPVLA